MTWCDTQTTLNGCKVNVIHLLIEKQYYDRCSLGKTTMYNYLWFLQNRIFNHITYTYFSNDWVIAWLFLQMHMMIRFSLFYLYVPNTYIVDTDLGSTQIRKQVKLLVPIIGINVLVILGIQGVSYVITEKNSAQRTLTMQRKNMEMASSVLCSASKFMSLPVALLKFRCKYSILTKKVRKATTNKHTHKQKRGKHTPPPLEA